MELLKEVEEDDLVVLVMVSVVGVEQNVTVLHGLVSEKHFFFSFMCLYQKMVNYGSNGVFIVVREAARDIVF